MNGEKSQLKAEEHVQHSPLLHALSSLSLTSLDQPLSVSAASRPLPCTPAPGGSSPLTPPPDPWRKASDPGEAPSRNYVDVPGADRCMRNPSNMAASEATAASPQDLYVPMDPIHESAHTQAGEKKTQRSMAAGQEATKPTNDSQEVDRNR